MTLAQLGGGVAKGPSLERSVATVMLPTVDKSILVMTFYFTYYYGFLQDALAVDYRTRGRLMSILCLSMYFDRGSVAFFSLLHCFAAAWCPTPTGRSGVSLPIL